MIGSQFPVKFGHGNCCITCWLMVVISLVSISEFPQWKRNLLHKTCHNWNVADVDRRYLPMKLSCRIHPVGSQFAARRPICYGPNIRYHFADNSDVSEFITGVKVLPRGQIIPTGGTQSAALWGRADRPPRAQLFRCGLLDTSSRSGEEWKVQPNVLKVTQETELGLLAARR